MFKGIPKIILIAILLAANYNGLCAVSGTYAWHSDDEAVPNNIYSVGTLDLTALSDTDFSPQIIVNADSLTQRTINLEKTGTLDVKYRVNAINFDGNIGLCQNLQMKTEGGSFVPLVNFQSDTQILESSASINLAAGLIDKGLPVQGQQCAFDLEITGWQKNLELPDGGFLVKKIIPSQIIVEYSGEVGIAALELSEPPQDPGNEVEIQIEEPQITLPQDGNSFETNSTTTMEIAPATVDAADGGTTPDETASEPNDSEQPLPETENTGGTESPALPQTGNEPEVVDALAAVTPAPAQSETPPPTTEGAAGDGPDDSEGGDSIPPATEP